MGEESGGVAASGPGAAPDFDTAAVLRRIPPLVAGAAGAACIAFSAPLVALSGTNAATASSYRCALAAPVLVLLARAERRHRGPLGRREHAVGWLAGALLGVDLLLWSQAIGEVGAGVSTVVVNLQVVLVPLLALAVDREPLTRRYGLAVGPMLAGVAMAAGVGGGAPGTNPVLGTVHAALAAVCYAGFLYLLRRGAGSGRLVAPLADVTLAAGVVSLGVGGLWQGITFAPGWPAFGWLIALALSGQVVGWLLIATALPRLSSRAGAALLVLQPVGAVVLGYLLLSQRPTPIQLAGCALVLAAVLAASTERRADPEEEDR